MKWLKNQLTRVMQWLDRFRPIELILGGLIGISAAEFGVAELHHLLYYHEAPHLWGLCISIVVAGGAAWRVYHHAHRLISVRTRKFRNEVPAPRCEHLVVFVTKLNLKKLKPDGTPEGLTLGKSLDEDIRQLEAAKPGVLWAWEMPLRAIRAPLQRPRVDHARLFR